MKRKIILSETNLINLIKKIIKEQVRNDFIPYDNSNDDNVEEKKPYFFDDEDGVKKLDDTKTTEVKKSEEKVIIFVSGLNDRGYFETSKQLEIFKNGLSPEIKLNSKIVGFPWQNKNKALEYIDEVEQKNGETPYVFLFSKGGQFSNEFADKMNDKNRLFIVEPYNASTGTLENVINALDSGVPHSNLLGYDDKYCSRGCIKPAKKYPNYQDYTRTPSSYVGIDGHWKSLTYAASIFI